MNSVEEDRKLIQIVEYHDILWDNRLKGFRDKKLTHHAWASAAEVLERDVRDVMQRWGDLRKKYIRKVTQPRQRTASDCPDKQWPFLPCMSFLKPCITARKAPLHRQQSNYPSTEELSSSSMSDGCSEVQPLLIRLNTANKSFEQGKKTKFPKSITSAGSQVSTTIKNIAVKSKEQNKILPIMQSSSTATSEARVYKELSDSEQKILNTNVNAKSAGSATMSQCAEVKPVIRHPQVNVKKLKTSKDIAVLKRHNQESSKDVSGSKNLSSDVSKSKSYDADEFFLLSLAPDLRKMSSRMKYEAKSKMLDIVSEQYLKN